MENAKCLKFCVEHMRYHHPLHKLTKIILTSWLSFFITKTIRIPRIPRGETQSGIYHTNRGKMCMQVFDDDYEYFFDFVKDRT
jgi:hypothetical protein